MNELCNKTSKYDKRYISAGTRNTPSVPPTGRMAGTTSLSHPSFQARIARRVLIMSQPPSVTAQLSMIGRRQTGESVCCNGQAPDMEQIRSPVPMPKRLMEPTSGWTASSTPPAHRCEWLSRGTITKHEVSRTAPTTTGSAQTGKGGARSR